MRFLCTKLARCAHTLKSKLELYMSLASQSWPSFLQHKVMVKPVNWKGFNVLLLQRFQLWHTIYTYIVELHLIQLLAK